MSILQMSLSASLLILIVIAIRSFVFNNVPKKTFLALWGIVLLRLMVPFSVPFRFSIYSVASNISPAFTSRTDSNYLQQAFLSKTATYDISIVTSNNAGHTNPVVYIWIIGLAALSIFFIILFFKCRREFCSAAPLDKCEFVEQWIIEHKIARTIRIKLSDKVIAPLTYGILRPVILLPQNIDLNNTPQLQYILAHELIHIKHFDALWKILLAAALCFHWFNPLVWIMYSLANRDLELACDEVVVNTFGEKLKSSYALLLISMEENKSRFVPLCNNFSRNAIEERIVSIMKFKKTTAISLILATILVIGTAVIFATSSVPGKNVKTVSSAPASSNGTTIDPSKNALDEKGSSLEPKNSTGASITSIQVKNNNADKTIAIMENELARIVVENDHGQYIENKSTDNYSITTGNEEPRLIATGEDITFDKTPYLVAVELDNNSPTDEDKDLKTAVKSYLDKQVANGKITKKRADEIFNELTS